MKQVRQMPLQGVKVVEFTTAWVGNEAGFMLGQMGADVIKIENPGLPDYWRRSPAFAEGKVGVNRSGIFAAINRGKKDAVIDLKKPANVELLKKLIARSDIVVTNFAPRVMDNLGLGYSVIKEVKPDIIMVAASGYGATGPDKQCVAFGHVLEAYSGLDSVVGNRGGTPLQPGTTVSDHSGAILACYAAMVAWYHHMVTGEGQYVDLSEVEGVVSIIPEVIMDYVMNGRNRVPQGNRDDVMAPHGCYPCSGDDKWIAICVKGDEEWSNLCAEMGQPQLAKDPRFSDGFVRLEHQDELDKIIREWTKDLNNIDVMKRLQARGIAAGPVYSGQELYADPHLRAREFFIEHEHPEVGKRELPGVFAKLSETPLKVNGRDPLYGEHTEWLLKELADKQE